MTEMPLEPLRMPQDETSHPDPCLDTPPTLSTGCGAKTNVCLVNLMCMTYMFGYAHCDKTCLKDVLYRATPPEVVERYADYVERVAPHIRKIASRLIKGVYFG